MTYSQFAKAEETLPRAMTKFRGIAVIVDPGQPFFTAIVNEALTALSGLATGQLLLAEIASAAPKDDRGYKVLINRVSITYKQAMDSTG